MADTNDKAPVSVPTIAVISPSKSVRRSERIMPQRKIDYSVTAAVSNKKKANHESHNKEVSNPRGVSIADTSPATSTEVPSTVAVEDGSGARGEERVRGKGSARRKKLVKTPEVVSMGTDESIQCFCGSKQERGEMVCCEVCAGWFHLKCMGMKEGTNLLKEKEFVCHLCVSSVMLKMREEIMVLRRELEGVRKGMKSVEDQNALLQEQLVKERVVEVSGCLKTGKSKWSEGRIGGHAGKQKITPKVEKKRKGGNEDALVTEGEVQVMEDHPQALSQEEGLGAENQPPKFGKSATSRQRANKQRKQINGVRKVWGTKKCVSCNDVAKAVVKAVGRVSSSFSVCKRNANVKGKNKWWFVVKAPERCLQTLDRKWDHKFWQWQKLFGSAGVFLEGGPVSDRHR